MEVHISSKKGGFIGLKSTSAIALIGLAALLAAGCSEKLRPDVNDGGITFSGGSILKTAAVTVADKDGKTIATTQTDADGGFSVSNAAAFGTVTVKACGGKFYSSGVAGDISTNLCVTQKTAASSSTGLVVDALSTFIDNYTASDATAQWLAYMGVSTHPFPVLETTLTDATKVYLWTQGLTEIAKQVSTAAGVAPETTYSTQALVMLLLADLKDDNIINGSTGATFGGLTIDGEVLKSVMAAAIPNVPSSFTAADLKTWTDSIKNSTAVFLSSKKPPDPEKPVVTIDEPKETTVAGTFTIKAHATDNVAVVSLICSFKDVSIPNKLSDVDKYEATVDTTSMEDGPGAIIKCIASDGINTGDASLTLSIKNKNKVSFGVYVSEIVTELDAIYVTKIDGTAVATLQPDQEGKIETELAPGWYVFKTDGGLYQTIVLNPDPKTPLYLNLGQALTSRAEVKAGLTTKVIITPITTLRESLYKALLFKADPEATTKSLDLIADHFKVGFDIYTEPGLGSVGDVKYQYYVALSSLEQLAKDIAGYRGLTIGTINIDDILSTLTYDLKDALLDGTGGTQKIQGWPIDSYFFRYWYAVAVKAFAKASGQSFADFQSLISKIAMDTSELFPVKDTPREVVDDEPGYAQIQYTDSRLTTLADYDFTTGKVPVSTGALSYRFKIVLGTDQAVADVTTLSDGMVCVKPTVYDSKNNIYETTCTLIGSQEDGDKTVEISTEDTAYNVGKITLHAIKDTIKPTLDLSGLPTTPVKSSSTSAAFVAAYADVNLLGGLYSVTSSAITDAPLIQGANSLTGLLAEGVHTINAIATDKAGNATTKNAAITIDNTAPYADPGCCTVVLPAATVTRDNQFLIIIPPAKLHDNYTPPDLIALSYIITKDGAEYQIGTITTKNKDGNYQLSKTVEANSAYVFNLFLTDQAGNTSTSVFNFSWTVDQHPPTISDFRFRTDYQGWKPYSYDTGVIPYTADKSFTFKFLAVGYGGRSVEADTIAVLNGSGTAQLADFVCINPRLEGGYYQIDCTVAAGVENGSIFFKLSIYDEIGNQAIYPASGPLVLVYDTVKPVVTVSDCPKTPKKSSSDDLKFKAAIVDVNYESSKWKLNSGSDTSYTNNETISLKDNSNLLELSNTVTVSAVDKAGNEGTGTCTFTVDNTPPAGVGAASLLHPDVIQTNSTTLDRDFNVMVNRQKLTDNVSPWDKITVNYKYCKDDSSCEEAAMPVYGSDPNFYKVSKTDVDKAHKYSYELTAVDQAGNTKVIDSLSWFVDYTPPPLMYSGPTTTNKDTADCSLWLGAGDQSNPDKTLYPPTGEVLDSVVWKDITQGTSGTCTCTSNQCPCTVNAGATPIQGVHTIYFVSYDLLDNHVADSDLATHCLDSDNAHCRKATIIWDNAAPDVQLTLDRAATKKDLKISWKVESNTSYVCTISAPSTPNTPIYTCPNTDNGKTLDMSVILSGYADGTYVVKVVATRYGKTSDPTATFIMDRTPPNITDVVLVSQNGTNITVKYTLTDLVPGTATINVHDRSYYDNNGDLQEDDPSTIILNNQPFINGDNTFTTSVTPLAGGAYWKFYICATDGVLNTACKDISVVKCTGFLDCTNPIQRTTRDTGIIQRNTCTHKRTIKGVDYCYLDVVIRLCDSCIPSGLSWPGITLTAIPVSSGVEYDLGDYVFDQCNGGCDIFRYVGAQQSAAHCSMPSPMTINRVPAGFTTQASRVRDSFNYEAICENSYNEKPGLTLCYASLNTLVDSDIADNSCIGCDKYFVEWPGNSTIWCYNADVYSTSSMAVFWRSINYGYDFLTYADVVKSVYNIYATFTDGGRYTFKYELVP